MKIIDLHNSFHLGDSVFIMILFYNIKDYIETNNILINYYCHENYHKQLSEFICSNNIKLLNYTQNNIGLNVWIGNDTFKYNIFNNNLPFNDFYVIFFNQLLEICNIQFKLEKLTYTDIDLLNRFNNLNKKYNNVFLNIDILIINSVPCSGQYVYIEEDWNNFCIELNKKYNIITTKKVQDIKCTLDYDLTIKDISAISTNIKKIIAVNTGVIVGLFNEYTLNNIDSFYYFDKDNSYSYSKFKKCNSLNELNFLVDTKNIETFISCKYNNMNIYIIMFLLLGMFIISIFNLFFYKKLN